MTARILLAVWFLAMAGCSMRPGMQEADWERSAIDAKANPRETASTPPSYPLDSDLIEFFAGPTGSHRYFIDAKTLTVGADGVLRYTTVVRTTGGASNVTYQGLRCATRQKRVYASGQAGQKWVEAKGAGWEPIAVGRANEYQAVLYNDYFCPDRILIKDKDTALQVLRRARDGFDTRERATE